jgi:subtilase family serine protease
MDVRPTQGGVMKKRFRIDAARALLIGAALFVPLAFGQASPDTVPGAVSLATQQDSVNPAMQMNITVWLKMHNKGQFDQTLEALYTPGSPQFHHWLTTAELSKYAPTDADIGVVRNELQAHGFTITDVDANRFLIRARGPVSSVESAFHTQIHNFRKDGQTFYANATEAGLTGPAAKLVEAVSGFDNLAKKSMAKQRVSLRTGKPAAGIPFTTARDLGGLLDFITADCFPSTTPQTFAVPTSDGNGGPPPPLPRATYTGNRYISDDFIACGYTVPDMQKAYGLDKVYQQGLNGEGQTIVIVDPFGSPTIQQDANAFSQLNGLPQLTADNFQVINPLGQPNPFQDTWVLETSLDVEWAHAIAPNAKIVLLVLPTDVEDADFQYAIFYAAIHGLGSSISNSYGCFEFNVSRNTLRAYDYVISIAAAMGISTNYASGDSGDTGLGKPIGEASTPSDSPHATSVGGTSLGIPDGNGGTVQVGWGMEQNFLNFDPDLTDPASGEGFFFGGSGGGESVVFPKPAYQHDLPGRGRQQPDISAVGDPFTGGVFVLTPTGQQQQIQVIGGTSLSTPIFSAIWALANQKAGHLLGNAAPAVAHMPPSAVLDVVPITSPTNPSGVIIDANGTTSYSAADLLTPDLRTRTFYSALCSFADGAVLVDLSFGTDTSLKVTKGWDNVTGFGTPNGLKFIEAAARQ